MTRTTLLKKLTTELIMQLKSDVDFIYNERIIYEKLNQAMTIGSEKYPVNKISRPNARPVIQLTKDGKYVDRFPSTADAARKLGMNQSSQIVRSCNDLNGKITCRGYLWRYET